MTDTNANRRWDAWGSSSKNFVVCSGIEFSREHFTWFKKIPRSWGISGDGKSKRSMLEPSRSSRADGALQSLDETSMVTQMRAIRPRSKFERLRSPLH
jgi:hypothetical protein